MDNYRSTVTCTYCFRRSSAISGSVKMCTISVKNPTYLRVIEVSCGLTKRKSEEIPTLVIHNYSKLSTVIHSLHDDRTHSVGALSGSTQNFIKRFSGAAEAASLKTRERPRGLPPHMAGPEALSVAVVIVFPLLSGNRRAPIRQRRPRSSPCRERQHAA